MSDENIEEALQPDTFNFLDVLAERSYPKDKVSVYLDEGAAYKAKATRLIIEDAKTDAEVKKLQKLLKQYSDDVKKSEYIFHLTGVSSERAEEIIELAKDKYPVEKRTRKLGNGSLEQYEVPSPERNEYVGYLMFWIYVEAIEAPDGKIHAAPDIENIIQFIKKAPQSQVEKVAEAIADLRVSSELFEEAIDDDFLAKS